GVKLTAFELISARAFAGGHSLYDMWNEALQQQPLLRDFDVDPMYLLQVIALRRGASCKPRAVLRLSAEVIAAEWASVRDDYAEALRMLRGECGVLIRKWLPYATMLVPMVAVWPE